MNVVELELEWRVSTRSRPKAADRNNDVFVIGDDVSTRSRPKAAECSIRLIICRHFGFNSQPPEGG